MSERNLQYNTLFTVDTDRSGLVDLEKSAERFGMRLRLSGRDFLRLGGSIGGVMNSMQSSLTGFLGKSMDWQVIMEDIGFAFEDIADVVMETLGPIFEVFVDYLDGLASVMEDNPWIGQLLAVGAILIFIIGIVGKGFTIFAKFYGILTLLVGTLITVGGSGLGIGDAFKYLFIRITKGEEASLRWLAANEKVKKSLDTEGKAKIKDLMGNTLKEKEANNQKLGALNKEESKILSDMSVWNKMGSSFTNKLKGTPIYEQMEKEKLRLQEISQEKSDIIEQNGYLSRQEGVYRTSLKKGRMLTQKEENKILGKQKQQVGLWQRAKGGVNKYGKAIKGVGMAIGGGGLLYGLITAWEPMIELFEAIGDAINTALEPLEPMMESLIEWIDENPAFATALSALFAFLISALPMIMSLLGGLLGGGGVAGGSGGLLATLGGVGASLGGILSAAGPVVLVIGAIIFEVWRLIEFFKALFDVWGDMGSWVMQAVNDPFEFISRLVVVFLQAFNEAMTNFPITRWIMELFGVDPDKLKQIYRDIMSDFMGSGVGVLEDLENSVKTVFSSIAESFGIPAGSFSFLWDLIKSFVQFLLGDTVGSFNTLQGAMGQIGTVVSEITIAFGGFINWVGSGFQWLIDVMKPVMDFFNGAWSQVSGFFNSVGSFFGISPVSNIMPSTPLGINTMNTTPYTPITPQAIAKDYASKTVPDINVTFNGVIDDRSAKTIADRLQKEFTKVLGRIN